LGKNINEKRINVSFKPKNGEARLKGIPVKKILIEE